MKFAHQLAIDKEAQKRTEELREHLADVAHKIAVDQEQWMDDRMKELLRPDIYEKAKADDCHEEVDGYFKSHQIKITFIPDSGRIRIDVKGQPYAEFVPGFQIDGDPIEMKPKMIGDVGLN